MTEEQEAAFNKAINDVEAAWYAVESLRRLMIRDLTGTQYTTVKAMESRLTKDVEKLIQIKGMVEHRAKSAS